MKPQELTIKQIQRVMGISRPTALSIAQAHGHMSNDKWFVPAAVIQGMVDAEILKAQKMQMRLNECGDSGS